ncbi:hypothetical protein AJ79_03777 [Helicocarpus griseus UAMH5409]|uniref:Major facilitator superfamily (MFS) profile domain-containing protein n=1 Tax=Helicocarpus griseus UAMH5409 TaxID=1447875 RepID=A0A2B7XW94_9EURO|nr:hypothetical protein AJ79_03777 [Helicocarpus griseus UAMH5409]
MLHLGSKTSLNALIIALTVSSNPIQHGDSTSTKTLSQLAVLLAALDGTIVATALPSITEELKNADGYAWVGSAYLLAVTAFLPIWGGAL